MSKKKKEPEHLGLTDEPLPEEHPAPVTVDEATGLPPSSADAVTPATDPASKLTVDPKAPERLGPDQPTDDEGKVLGVTDEEDDSWSELHVRAMRPEGFRAAGYAFTSGAVSIIKRDDLTPEQLERIQHAAKHAMLRVVKQ